MVKKNYVYILIKVKNFKTTTTFTRTTHLARDFKNLKL